MSKKRNLILGSAVAGIAAICLLTRQSKPKKARPVTNFNVEDYMGDWFEIARFDYRFERGLNNAAAQYWLTDDGKVNVRNSGYNILKSRWQKVEGVARFRGSKDVAALKVSFFGPFYAGYNVVAITDDYRQALVAGKNLNYLWFLSREPSMPEAIKQRFLQKATEIGYDTDRLLWIVHDKSNPYIHAI